MKARAELEAAIAEAGKGDEGSGRPTVGDYVIVTKSGNYSGRCGPIVKDDHDGEPYKVRLGEETTGWLKESEVRKHVPEHVPELGKAIAAARQHGVDGALIQKAEAAQVRRGLKPFR